MSEPKSLEHLFAGLDRVASAGKKVSKNIIRAPFGYPGGKSRIVDFIHSHLPQRELFVDVFGGGGTVFLNRDVKPGDVFNDINSGVCSVFRCFRDPVKYDKMLAFIASTIHCYEDWVHCKETWKDANDDVERACRWLYMMHYSFGSMGRNYGYVQVNQAFSGKLASKVPAFQFIREKFRHANVENQDWEKILKRYDTFETVFYLDPPYFDSDTQACYGANGMNKDEHQHMLGVIENLKGFVALSGYANNLYDSQSFWTSRHTVIANVTIGDKESRGKVEEVLWIKEAQ